MDFPRSGNEQCRGLRALYTPAGGNHTQVEKCISSLKVYSEKNSRNVLGTKCLADILSEREKIANWMEQTLGKRM